MLSRADVLALPLSHPAQQSQGEFGAIGIISQQRASVWPTPYLSRRSRLSTSPCYASYPPSCPTLPPAYKYAADATMQGTGHTLVHLARTAAAPPIAPSPEIAAPQTHAGLVGNFTIAMNAPSKPKGKPTSNASFAVMNAHDGEKINVYVGYVPPSESIPVSTWWTALLNRVSLPEAPSTLFCFCFCFCCSLSSIFCSTVCVSGLHPADLQRAPTVCHACLSCVNRVCTAVGTQVTAQNLYFPSRSSSDLIRF